MLFLYTALTVSIYYWIMDDKKYLATIKIPFSDAVKADMVRRCLEVDEELQPMKVTKTLECEEAVLIV